MRRDELPLGFLRHRRSIGGVEPFQQARRVNSGRIQPDLRSLYLAAHGAPSRPKNAGPSRFARRDFIPWRIERTAVSWEYRSFKPQSLSEILP